MHGSSSIYMGSHSHDHVIPEIKYTMKDVFAADTLIDIFMENNQHCTKKNKIEFTNFR